MGAIELYAVPARKPARTEAAERGLSLIQAAVGGEYDRVAIAWRDGKRSEKELLLHVAGCPVKWALSSWGSIPVESQIQIRERARAMSAWLHRLVGVSRDG